MQTCGGCSLQDVNQVAQVLMNPGTWVLALATVTALLNVKTKKKENK